MREIKAALFIFGSISLLLERQRVMEAYHALKTTIRTHLGYVHPFTPGRAIGQHDTPSYPQPSVMLLYP